MAGKTRLATVAESPRPSTSTVVGAALGAPAAIVVVWIVEAAAGIVVPAEVGAALGSLLGALLGMFFPGGISADTK